jgi:signal transduction histidine kinase
MPERSRYLLLLLRFKDWIVKNTGQLVQLAWIAFTVLILSLVLAGMPYRFAELQVICGTPLCMNGQPTTESISQLIQQGLEITPEYLRGEAFNKIAIQSILHVIIFCLALVLIWQKPRNLAAVLSAFVFLVLAALLSSAPDAFARARPEYELFIRFLRFFLMTGLVVIFLLLPDGHFSNRRTGWLTAVIAALFFYFTFIQKVTLAMPLGPANALFGITSLLVGVVVAVSLVSRYLNTSLEIERQQLKWILVGSSVAIGWFILIHLLFFLFPAGMRGYYAVMMILIINVIVGTFFVGSIAVAILQFQLFDIDAAINRGLVYSTLTVLIIAGYSLIVSGLNVVFTRLNPLNDHNGQFLVPLIATSLIVIAFQPLRDRLQRGVNRLMYGERDEPYQVLTRLGQSLDAAIEPASALPLTVDTIANALKLVYVAITLKQQENFKTVAAYGTYQDSSVRIPLIYAGQVIGELIAAGRAPGEPLTEPDLRLLNDLARQISSTAETVRLSDALERARFRIVETEEETRRRLGSDLHDGVGHQLTGLARKAERAANLLSQDSSTARNLLTDIQVQLDQTILQVRQLAHQLYPPELELLGLIGALRERIQANDDPNLIVRPDLPETLPRLPTAIESAAYYIALEALTNVARHAGATTCSLRLNIESENEGLRSRVLELEIWDDGRGLSSTDSTGLGLLSMQARAAEVGGVCTIAANPGGGTRITVRLPCEVQEE